MSVVIIVLVVVVVVAIVVVQRRQQVMHYIQYWTIYLQDFCFSIKNDQA